jgi:hypothetical protein
MSGRLVLNRDVPKNNKRNTSGRKLEQGEIVTTVGVHAGLRQGEGSFRVRDASGTEFDLPADALDVL